MKKLLPLLIFLIACEGRLTDEQRKKIKQEMELNQIKRVTDVEITEAAYETGRRIVSELEKVRGDSVKLRVALDKHNARARWVIPGKSNVTEVEQQLIEAYLADESGALQDNVQKVRRGNVETDSILYSRPVVTKLPDGSEILEGIWNVWLSKKQIIIGMKK